jgi:hypothetical protein
MGRVCAKLDAPATEGRRSGSSPGRHAKGAAMAGRSNPEQFQARQGVLIFDLAGWSERSVFGWDHADWWAELWPDGDERDEPVIWLGFVPPIGCIAALINEIARRTGATVAAVSGAMIEGLGTVGVDGELR